MKLNTASFRLRRYGSTANELSVNFTVSGSATNGTDYKQVGIAAVFPAGESSVLMIRNLSRTI
ncbi:MAG: hypothetical protein QM760_17910 [Nibricoccus sp.]